MYVANWTRRLRPASPVVLALLTFCIASMARQEGRIAQSEQQPPYGVTSLVFSPNNRLLAIVRGDLVLERHWDRRNRRYYQANSAGEVEIRSLVDGSVSRTITDFGGPVRDAAFSRDGEFLATASYEPLRDQPAAKSNAEGYPGVLRLWNVATGELKWSRRAHDASVLDVTFSPDGRLIATAGSSYRGAGEVKVWGTATGEVVKKLGYMSSAFAVAFSPNGSVLAVKKQIYSEPRAEVKLYGTADWKESRVIREPKEINESFRSSGYGLRRRRALGPLVFSADGSRIAITVNDVDAQSGMSYTQLWDMEGDKESHALKWHSGPISVVAFGRDGKTVATLGRETVLRIWDTESGEQLRRGANPPATAVALSNDCSLIAIARDNNVNLWEMGSSRHVASFTAETETAGGLDISKLVMTAESTVAIAYSTDGALLAGGSDTGELKVYDALAAVETLRLEDGGVEIRAVAFSPSGYLATGSSDGHVRIWDAGSGALVAKFLAHAGEVTSVAYSPDGSRLATSGTDKTIRVWKTAALSEKPMVLEHAVGVLAVRYSPDGRWLAGAGQDGAIQLWDWTTGDQAITIKVGEVAVASLAVSADGRYIAAADGRAVKIFDASSGELRQSLGGHDARVNSVAISPDSRSIASGSDDRTVRVWNIDGGSRRTLKGHDIGVFSIAFSPDGRTLASGTGNGAVALWDPATGELKRVIREVRRIPFRRSGG